MQAGVLAAATVVVQHGHQRDDAGATADKQHRAGLVTAQHEVGGERAANLDLVADIDDVVDVRRDIPVGEAVDRQLDRAVVRGEEAVE